MTSFRARTHPRALGTLQQGRLPCALPAQVHPPGPAGLPPALSSLALGCGSGGDALIRGSSQASRSPAPEPILQRQLIDSRMSGRERRKTQGWKGQSITGGTGRGETRPPEGLALLPGYRHAPLPKHQLPPSIAGAGQGSEPWVWRGTHTSLLHPGLRAWTGLLGLTP